MLQMPETGSPGTADSESSLYLLDASLAEKMEIVDSFIESGN